jgi:hypothetical protein
MRVGSDMRRIWMLGILCVTLVAGLALSYLEASHTATMATCGLPSDMELARVRFGPQHLPTDGWRLAWIFSYGPKAYPGDTGPQLFVSPSGHLMVANPPTWLARVAASPQTAGVHCGGAA